YTYTHNGAEIGAQPQSDQFQFRVSDGHGFSTVATVEITITPVNDPPQITAPLNQGTARNQPLVFSAAPNLNNPIQVSDPDAGTNPLVVTLQAVNGTATLGQTTGLVRVEGDGTSLVTLEGSPQTLNAALEGLTFQPTLDFVGPASLIINVDD